MIHFYVALHNLHWVIGGVPSKIFKEAHYFNRKRKRIFFNSK